jgi:transcriptional regulator with XRE-family HTH domain
MPNPALKLHALLEARLSELGMSFRAAAAEMEVSASTLTRLQSGAMPHWDTLVAITTWAGIDIRELLPASAVDESEETKTKRWLRMSFIEGLQIAREDVSCDDPELWSLWLERFDGLWAELAGMEPGGWVVLTVGLKLEVRPPAGPRRLLGSVACEVHREPPS